MSDFEHGTPIGEVLSEGVDVWSQHVFEACQSWPLARSGRWFQSDEGYLRLRIEEVDGEALEPLSVIELDTSEERVLLDFGSWGTPISNYQRPRDWNAKNAVEEARDLIERWLRGEVKIASYSDETGWRGSKIIERGGLPASLEPTPVEIGTGAEVVVKTFRRSGWTRWIRTQDCLWRQQEINVG